MAQEDYNKIADQTMEAHLAKAREQLAKEKPDQIAEAESVEQKRQEEMDAVITMLASYHDMRQREIAAHINDANFDINNYYVSGLNCDRSVFTQEDYDQIKAEKEKLNEELREYAEQLLADKETEAEQEVPEAAPEQQQVPSAEQQRINEQVRKVQEIGADEESEEGKRLVENIVSARDLYAKHDFRDRRAMKQLGKFFSGWKKKSDGENSQTEAPQVETPNIASVRMAYEAALKEYKDFKVKELEEKFAAGGEQYTPEKKQAEIKKLLTYFNFNAACNLYDARTQAKLDYYKEEEEKGGLSKKMWYKAGAKMLKMAKTYQEIPAKYKIAAAILSFGTAGSAFAIGNRGIGLFMLAAGGGMTADALIRNGEKISDHFISKSNAKKMIENEAVDFAGLNNFLNEQIAAVDTKLKRKVVGSVIGRAATMVFVTIMGKTLLDGMHTALAHGNIASLEGLFERFRHMKEWWSGGAHQAAQESGHVAKSAAPAAAAKAAAPVTKLPDPHSVEFKSALPGHTQMPGAHHPVAGEHLPGAEHVSHAKLPTSLEVKGQRLPNGSFKSESIWGEIKKLMRQKYPKASQAELNRYVMKAVNGGVNEYAVEHNITPHEAMARLSKIHHSTLDITYDNGTPKIHIKNVKFMHSHGVNHGHGVPISQETPPTPPPTLETSAPNHMPNIEHAPPVDNTAEIHALEQKIAVERAQLPGSSEIIHGGNPNSVLGQSGYGDLDNRIVHELLDNEKKLKTLKGGVAGAALLGTWGIKDRIQKIQSLKEKGIKNPEGFANLGELFENKGLIENPNFRGRVKAIRQQFFGNKIELLNQFSDVKMGELVGDELNKFLFSLANKNGRSMFNELKKTYPPKTEETLAKWTMRIVKEWDQTEQIFKQAA